VSSSLRNAISNLPPKPRRCASSFGSGIALHRVVHLTFGSSKPVNAIERLHDASPY